MKKYEYVKLHIGKFIGAGSNEHRKIIDEYAEKGYRYAGYIPTDITDYGKIKEMDLIFEKDK
ncbi:MAG: DUF4177 domain-containing protein [Oscillospiraceae bacterium]|nr:DUF4177 domain-containing protein [Oscillospiraceae bacterium]